jgi:hypothetical protein
VVGATAGAAAGALIGRGLGGGGGTGALVAAGLGALIGMLVGDHLQAKQPDPASTAPQPAPPRPPTPGPSRPAAGDPTKGEFINGTSWLLRVYINPDPEDLEKTTPIVLQPVEKVPWGLDVGQYRIIARAYAGTQYGERLVGRYDRTIEIDIRRAGWFLEFGEEDFR